MIYYGRNKKRVVDYAAPGYQLCWTCKNACGGCSWSRDFVPVEGWTAKKTIVVDPEGNMESYKITKCPGYVVGQRYGVFDGTEMDIDEMGGFENE